MSRFSDTLTEVKDPDLSDSVLWRRNRIIFLAGAGARTETKYTIFEILHCINMMRLRNTGPIAIVHILCHNNGARIGAVEPALTL
jgi:hypothetical protein